MYFANASCCMHGARKVQSDNIFVAFFVVVVFFLFFFLLLLFFRLLVCF